MINANHMRAQLTHPPDSNKHPSVLVLFFAAERNRDRQVGIPTAEFPVRRERASGQKPSHTHTGYLMDIVEFTKRHIVPEAKRLMNSGQVSSDFKIRQALVLLPTDRAPIVQFNEQIQWKMRMDTSSFRPGQAVYLHDIKKVTGVEFPKVGDKKVAFIFFYYTGTKYSLLFDFSPNSQPQGNTPEYGYASDRTLTSYYNLFFSEMALNALPESKSNALSSAGFFVTPAIMPYPFTVLCDPTRTITDFLTALHSHFSCDALLEMVNNWSVTPGWRERATIFQEAVGNMADKRFASVISLLVPQLEGVLRDTVYLLCNDASYMNSQKACEVLRKEIDKEEMPKLTHRYLSSFMDFFNEKSGLFLSFKKWTDDLSEGFISRHVVSHGKHAPEMYTRENCLRLFLVMSTIHEIASALHGTKSSF